MANRARPTLQKRQKERERQQRQKDKEARRVEAKERRQNAPEKTNNNDPDIDGIIAGPQPLPEELQDWEDWEPEV